MESIKEVLKWIGKQFLWLADIRDNTLLKITLLIAGSSPVMCWLLEPTNKQYIFMSLLMWSVIAVALTYMRIAEHYEEREAVLLQGIKVVHIVAEEIRIEKRYPVKNQYYEAITKEVAEHEENEMH
ncbi:hypothetical protein [Veillonella sp. VA141]|uniref:hypothetical protein n=1 Tax=Veillonella sp. VA141 TaxID=741833 RepID=UPI000F8EE1CB|nr:hypothetical protein [Veillonella sp. VA141]